MGFSVYMNFCLMSCRIQQAPNNLLVVHFLFLGGNGGPGLQRCLSIPPRDHAILSLKCTVHIRLEVGSNFK